MVTEINFFTYGDSTDAGTWSNVPFMMSQELERRGIILHRINVKPNKIIEKIINRILRVLKFPESYSYIRTPLFLWWVDKRIKHNVKKNINSQFSLFMNFDMMDFWSSKPSLVFGDWTYEYAVTKVYTEIPTKYQKKYFERQNQVIKNAAIILPLFEFTYYALINKFPLANIKRVLGNVINNLYPGEINNIEEYIFNKYNSNKAVFIGKPSYIKGLQLLAYAIEASSLSLNVDIIGMTEDDFPNAPTNFTFHGYLNKSIEDQRDKYYQILLNASFIVNPTPKWAGYSSIIEAMYFYTPVIVTKFDQFASEFGNSIDFGVYCDPNNPLSLNSSLKIMRAKSYDDYYKMAKSAHKSVENYTWSNYVDTMLRFMNDCLNRNK